MSTETRRNKAPNPSNEIAGGWANSNAAVYTVTDDATVAYVGTKSRKSVPIGAGIGVANGVIMSLFNVGNLAPFVIPNKQYTASMYVRQNVAVGVDTPSAQIGWVFLDSGQVAIGGVTYSSNIFPAQNTWTRISVTTSAAPSNAVYLRIYCVVKHINNVITDANDAAWADAILIEEGSVATDYFDGDTPNTSAFSYEWVGTVNGSESFELSLVIGTRRNKVIDPHLITASGWGGSVITGGAITGTQVYSPNFLSVPGEVWTVSCDCIAPAGSAFSGTLAMSPTTGAAFGSNTRVPTNFNVPAGTTQRISNTFTVNVGADGFRMLLNGMSPIDGTAKIDRILIEKTGSVRSYFDGNTPYADDGAVRYYWAGTANNSESVEETAVILRRNKALNPISPVGTSIALWAPVRGTAALNGDSLRLTINDATVALAAARITPSAGITTIAVKPNTTYTISSDFRTNSAAGGAITTQFYDSGSVIIGSLIFTVTPALNSSTFVRGSHTFTTPANAAYVLINIGTGSGPRNIGEWYDFRQVLIEESVSAQSYFDGNTTPANGINYYWLGAVNNSESVATGSSTGGSKGDTIYSDLLAGGYGPGSMADMEYKRLLAKNSLIAPQKLTLSDLYSLAGERPRIGAFRR
jgi:hypothetical protein